MIFISNDSAVFFQNSLLGAVLHHGEVSEWRGLLQSVGDCFGFDRDVFSDPRRVRIHGSDPVIIAVYRAQSIGRFLVLSASFLKTF